MSMCAMFVGSEEDAVERAGRQKDEELYQMLAEEVALEKKAVLIERTENGRRYGMGAQEKNVV